MKFKIKFIVFFIIISQSFVVLSQHFDYRDQFTIEWGQPMRFRGNVQTIIDIRGSSFSAIVNQSYGFNFFNNATRQLKIKEINNLNLSNIGKIKLRGDDKLVKVEGVLDVGSSAIAFSSRKRFLRREYHTYFHEFSRFNSNELIKGRPLGSYTLPKGAEATLDMGLASSRKGTYGATYLHMPTVATDYPALEYLIFNEKKGLVSEVITMLPFNEFELDIHEQFISDKGNYFILAEQYFKTNPNKGWGYRNRHFARLLLFYLKNKEIKEIKINEHDMFIRELTLYPEDDQTLVATGFYSDDISGEIRGVVFFRINKETMTVSVQNKIPFTKEFMGIGETLSLQSWFSGLSSVYKEENNFSNFQFKELQKTSDGGYLAVSEHVMIDVRTRGTVEAGNESQRYDHYYSYNDILIYKLSKEGELEWVQRIPKHQQSQNDGGFYLSFTHAIHNDKLYLFFNDHIKNYDTQNNYLELASLKVAGMRGRNNTIGAVVVDLSTGKVKRSSVSGKKELGVLFIPRLARKDHKNNSLIIYGNDNNRHRFGRIDLK